MDKPHKYHKYSMFNLFKINVLQDSLLIKILKTNL